MSRAELHAHAVRYFKSGGQTEPEVALVVAHDCQAIFKDYARTPGWFGRVIAPILLWREASALKALAGLAGIPKIYRQPDRRGILIEYLPAKPWPQARVPDAAYAQLESRVAAMHERGIAHCDLRVGGNILVDDEGQPYLVDFVARMRRGRAWNLPWNWLFRQFAAADRAALIKLRVRHAPHLASAADHAAMAHRGPMERLARGIGINVRRCVRFFVARS